MKSWQSQFYEFEEDTILPLVKRSTFRFGTFPLSLFDAYIESLFLGYSSPSKTDLVEKDFISLKAGVKGKGDGLSLLEMLKLFCANPLLPPSPCPLRVTLLDCRDFCTSATSGNAAGERANDAVCLFRRYKVSIPSLRGAGFVNAAFLLKLPGNFASCPPKATVAVL